MDLEQFLAQLESEGQKDSRGHFRLDPVRARQQLRRHQLANPHAYIGALLAAAHLAQLESAAVQVSADRVEVHLSGWQLSRQQLEDILSPLLVSGASRELRELALAVNASLALAIDRVEVCSGGWCKAFRKDQESLQACPQVPGMLFRLHYSSTQRLRRSLLRPLPESQLVRHYCSYAVPRLKLNGESVRPPLPDKRGLIRAIWQGYPQAFEGLLQEHAPEAPISLRLPGAGPHGGILSLYGSPLAGCGVYLVVEGLTFYLRDFDWGIPGAWGLVMAPQLRRDVSAFSLVQSPELEQLVLSLKQHFKTMLEKLLDKMETLNAVERFQARQDLLALAFLKWKDKNGVESLRLFRAVAASYSAVGASPDDVLARAVFAQSQIALFVSREQLQDYQIRDAYQQFIPLAKTVYDCVVCEDFKGVRGSLQVVDHADLFRRPVSSILDMMAEVCESLFGAQERRARHYRQLRQGLGVQWMDFFKLRRRPKA